jgi:hypothetical protein
MTVSTKWQLIKVVKNTYTGSTICVYQALRRRMLLHSLNNRVRHVFGIFFKFLQLTASVVEIEQYELRVKISAVRVGKKSQRG